MLASLIALIPLAGFAFEPFDRMMETIMTRYRLPGGQMAVATGKRLVLSRGYGYADVERKERVRPESLFRVGSVSKALTAAAVMTLVDRGLLRLDDKVFRILDDLKPPPGSSVDPRVYEISVLHLLQHAGGWDLAKSGDWLSQVWARTPGVTIRPPGPPDCATIIRIVLSRPLDFDPGTRVSYANFGYGVLGRTIERIAGKAAGKPVTYEEYVQAAVLKPAGVTEMRIGGTRLGERARGEVRYYGQPGQRLAPSVYPDEGDVPWAYGGYYMKALDAASGWIASAQDLVRFALAVDGRSERRLLSPESVRAMLETPAPGEASGTGYGWTITRSKAGYEWLRDGALRDTAWAVLIRRPDGITVAVTFNSVPDTSGGADSRAAQFSSHVVAELERTIGEYRKSVESAR
jgi:N-acyl-D-amino-acid deacylase